MHLNYNVTSGSGRAQVLCDEVHFCFTRFFVYKLLQCYRFLNFPSSIGACLKLCVFLISEQVLDVFKREGVPFKNKQLIVEELSTFTKPKFLINSMRTPARDSDVRGCSEH